MVVVTAHREGGLTQESPLVERKGQSQANSRRTFAPNHQQNPKNMTTANSKSVLSKQ